MPKSALVLPVSQVTPEPSLEKRTRRRFMADYKLHILAEADACQHGELGALLRREKLYSNQLCAWRREYRCLSTKMSGHTFRLPQLHMTVESAILWAGSAIHRRRVPSFSYHLTSVLDFAFLPLHRRLSVRAATRYPNPHGVGSA